MLSFMIHLSALECTSNYKHFLYIQGIYCITTYGDIWRPLKYFTDIKVNYALLTAKPSLLLQCRSSFPFLYGGLCSLQ